MNIDVKQFPLGPLQTNCYFLGCTTTKQAAIIDPAWNGSELAKYVLDAGYTLTHILLTHTHFDHIGGLADLKTAIDAPIYVHPEAVQMMKFGATSAQRFGITMPDAPPADEMLAAGDVIQVGDLTLDVLFTPGHAPGHVSFYLKSHHILFDGDVLFQRSIGRTDLPGGNFTELMDSIQTVLMPLPDETQVLSGHGPITTIGDERQHNPFLQ
ncbi:MAG: MBL fold metallo-hydrolase [Candidatus Promineifilaceae bacterium]